MRGPNRSAPGLRPVALADLFPDGWSAARPRALETTRAGERWLKIENILAFSENHW